MRTIICAACLTALTLAAAPADADIIIEPHPSVRKKQPKLIVVVRPHKALIVLTGKGVKATARGRLAQRHLAPGRYTLTISHPGHVTHTRKVTIKRKGKVVIRLDLKKRKKGRPGKPAA